jgi:hypothetical protein
MREFGIRASQKRRPAKNVDRRFQGSVHAKNQRVHRLCARTGCLNDPLPHAQIYERLLPLPDVEIEVEVW